jgi:hypothetical protein
MIPVTDLPKPVRRSIKPLIALLALAAMLLVAGCGGDDESTTTAATPPATTTASGDKGSGDEKGSDKDKSSDDGKEPKTVSQKDAPPVETIGAPKPPKGGDDSIHTFGKEASEADLRGSAAALNGYLQARVKRDWALACAYMSSGISEQLTQLAQQAPEGKDLDCAGILEAMSAHLDKKSLKRMASIKIGTARVDGDRAFVLYKEAGVGWMMMPMQRENGEWRVAAIAGSVLP